MTIEIRSEQGDVLAMTTLVRSIEKFIRQQLAAHTDSDANYQVWVDGNCVRWVYIRDGHIL